MQCAVKQEDLLRGITQALGCVENKALDTLVKGNLLLEAYEETLSIRSMGSNTGYTGLVPATVQKRGALVVPARDLSDYVKSGFPGDATMKLVSTDGDWLTVSCGRNRSRMAGIDANRFPADPGQTPSLGCIPAWLLVGVLRRACIATGDGKANPITAGVHVVLNPTTIEAYSTTGNMGAYVKEPCELQVDSPVEFTFHRSSVDEIVRLLAGNETDDVEIMLSNNVVRFAWATSTFYASFLAGRFPNVRLPLTLPTPRSATVDATALRNAVSRVRLFSNDSKQIELGFTEDGLCVLAGSTERGAGEESLEIDYTGPSVLVALNSTFLSHFLKVAGDKAITVEFKNFQVATKWQIKDDPTFTFMVGAMDPTSKREIPVEDRVAAE